MLSCVIDAQEMRKTAMVEIPGAFMQDDIENIVNVKFEGVMAKLPVKIYPKLYTKYAVKYKLQTVLYAALALPLYDTLRESLIFCSI